MGFSTQMGDIGPQSSKGIFTQTSPMLCDICLDCGEIVRLYVKDDLDKSWIKDESI
nr:hypothetical protein [Tissierella sp.]